MRWARGAQKNWTTANGGKKDLLHTQYVANKYFDTVEWKRHRASIILSKKKNCLQPSSQRYPLFLPPFAVIYFGSHFGWAPQNFMAVYFVPPLLYALLWSVITRLISHHFFTKSPPPQVLPQGPSSWLKVEWLHNNWTQSLGNGCPRILHKYYGAIKLLEVF